jgi:hypothetical protein
MELPSNTLLQMSVNTRGVGTAMKTHWAFTPPSSWNQACCSVSLAVIRFAGSHSNNLVRRSYPSAEDDLDEYQVGKGLVVGYGPVMRYVLYSGIWTMPGHWSAAGLVRDTMRELH